MRLKNVKSIVGRFYTLETYTSLRYQKCGLVDDPPRPYFDTNHQILVLNLRPKSIAVSP